MALYYNYEHYSSLKKGIFVNEPAVAKLHVCKFPFLPYMVLWVLCAIRMTDKDSAHCLDVLRQQLMCQVDIGVLGQIWVHPEKPEPFVDFHTVHRCRDFEAIRKWAEERQMPAIEDLPNDWYLVPPKEGDVYAEIP